VNRLVRSHAWLVGFLLTGTLIQPPAAAAPLPSWQVTYKATGYSFQTENSAGKTLDHYHHFQSLSGTASGLAGGKLTFRGAGRFAGDQLADINAPEQAKLYTGLAEMRFNPKFKALLGRQFVTAGVTSLTLDGALLNYRLNRTWNLSAWAGAKAPTTLAFELGEFGDDTALGARATFRPTAKWRLGFSASQRERGGQVAARPVGAEVMTRAIKNTRAFGRFSYDTEQELLARLQAQAQWRRSATSPVVDLQYIDRYPTVDAASWFSRFTDLKRIRLARAAVRHELPSRFGGEFEYLGSFVGERASSRLGLAALVPGGRIGYSVRLGDAGEENRLYGEFGHGVTPWLWLGAEATVMTYALMNDAPTDQERDLTALVGRARIDLREGVRLLAEVQSLANPDYDHDVRFLLGLDVSMARGSSRLGVDRGGWLQ